MGFKQADIILMVSLIDTSTCDECAELHQTVAAYSAAARLKAIAEIRTVGGWASQFECVKLYC